MRLMITLISLIFLAPAAAAAEPGTSLEAARRRIGTLIAGSGAETVGVAVYDTATGRSLYINEKAAFHAASTMKLPVMMEVFRQASLKRLSLDDRVEVRNSFRSIVDGSAFQLDPADDSDPLVFGWIGNRVPLIDLVDRMITWSSNLATNLVIERVGAAEVGRMMRALGARDMKVLRGVEDTKAFRAGLNNTATAYDLMLLVRALATRRFIDSRSCDRMLGILSAQHFNSGVPAGLPAGVRVAHKTGEITRHNHDAALVFPPGRKPYVIVVLTRGIDDRKLSDKLIADISGAVYQALK